MATKKKTTIDVPAEAQGGASEEKRKMLTVSDERMRENHGASGRYPRPPAREDA